MSFLPLSSHGKMEMWRKGFVGTERRAVTDRGAQQWDVGPRKTCLPQVWLSLLSWVFTPTCSRQPVVGRQPMLLQRLGLLPQGQAALGVWGVRGLWAGSRERWGCPAVDGEALPGWSPGMLRVAEREPGPNSR